MANKINKERLRAFILRRKLNAFGLLVLTLMSALVTIFCAIKGFARTDILVVCTVLLVVLCFIQAFKMRKSFRTMRAFRGSRKKSRRKE